MSQELNDVVSTHFQNDTEDGVLAKFFFLINNFLDKPEEWTNTIRQTSMGLYYWLRQKSGHYSIFFSYIGEVRMEITYHHVIKSDRGYMYAYAVFNENTNRGINYILSIMEEALRLVKDTTIPQDKLRWFKIHPHVLKMRN